MSDLFADVGRDKPEVRERRERIAMHAIVTSGLHWCLEETLRA